MAKQKKSNKSSNTSSNTSKTFASDNAGLTSNPFAALQGAAVPDGPAPSEGSTDTNAPTDAAANPGSENKEKPKPKPSGLAAVGRLIVRRQKKGQGGKTVACVEGLPTRLADDLVVRLKRALGCSGRVDGDTMILGTADHQGVARWLESQGANDVRLGN